MCCACIIILLPPLTVLNRAVSFVSSLHKDFFQKLINISLKSYLARLVPEVCNRNLSITRMHSSRMRTARSLAISYLPRTPLLPCMPPCHTCPPPCTPPPTTHAPATHAPPPHMLPPGTHAPCATHAPCYAHTQPPWTDRHL